jgi:hypothetical protein
MKIVSIFAGKLFAFHYDGETENELNRILALWNDLNYIVQFLNNNQQDTGPDSIENLAEQISYDATCIDDLLLSIAKSNTLNFESFFKPLRNSEYQLTALSLQKGRKNYLRIYALKIDENCFVITGGAIKLTHLMEDREHTQRELQKLENAKQYLKNNGVFDSDSFYEFLLETS